MKHAKKTVYVTRKDVVPKILAVNVLVCILTAMIFSFLEADYINNEQLGRERGIESIKYNPAIYDTVKEYGHPNLFVFPCASIVLGGILSIPGRINFFYLRLYYYALFVCGGVLLVITSVSIALAHSVYQY